MKAIITTLVAIIISIMCFGGASYGEPVTVDLEVLKGMNSSSRNEYIEGLVKKHARPESIVANVDPAIAEKWASLVTKTIKQICTDLSISVNEFIKTDVGKLTAILIVYKVAGEDIKNIFFGVIMWIAGMCLIIPSFMFFHVPKKIKAKAIEPTPSPGKYQEDTSEASDKAVGVGEKGATIMYMRRYKFKSSDAKSGSVAMHVTAAVILTILFVVLVIV